MQNSEKREIINDMRVNKSVDKGVVHYSEYTYKVSWFHVPRLGGSLISTSNSTHIRQSMMDITTLYVLVHGVGHGIPAMDGLHVSVVYV